jgi:class 3 adenylate cyclase
MIECPACGAANPAGSRFCNACGHPLDDLAPAPEVRKVVTVVFCDVTGSTALGEQLDPEALRRVMSRYFEAMTHAIEAHEGTVEKFIGDAVMAVFGIPAVHEDDALRAVRAAADMRAALGSLNKELERDHGTALVCRIGVHTGEVVAGDATARQALVTGDAVNVAARLEQAASPGQILISEETHALVRDAVVSEPVEALDLKGKAEPVRAHLLVEVHPDARGHGRRFDTPFVGRERELARLRQAFETCVAERACTLFTVLAPPGTGKSRLVREFLAGLGEDATVLRGRCLAYGDGITWFPLADVIRDALGNELDAPAKTIEARLAGDEHGPRVAAVLGGLVGGAEVSAGSEEVAWATRRFLEALARDRPVVAVLDDIQWADAPALDLIDHVSDWSRGAPILLLCMARPELLETRPDWAGGKLRATNASLEPLTPDETVLLATSLAGGGLDDPTRARIVGAAEGNPLFVEEIVAMLAEDGDPTAIPPTIQALLTARLDRLDEDDRAVLGRASVIGEVFYLDAVRTLSPEAERDGVDGRLRGLLRRELVRPEASDLPGVDAYRFHHALLRDAAYAMVPKETRAEWHEALAGWLGARPEPETDEFVGYHLGRAATYRRELGLTDERTTALAEAAGARLSAAGRRAAERQDVVTARALFERALELRAPRTADAGWDLLAYAWALSDEDRTTEAGHALDLAREASAAADDRRLIAHVELSDSWIRTLASPTAGFAEQRAALDRWRPEMEARGDPRDLAVYWIVALQEPWVAFRWGEVREFATRALTFALETGERAWVRRASAFQGAAGFYGATPLETLLEEGLERERLAEGSPLATAFVVNARGAILGMLGRDDEADHAFAQAAALAAEVGVETVALFAPRATLAETRDRPDEALAMLEPRYESAGAEGDIAHRSTLAGIIANLFVTLGRIDEARPRSEECRTLSDGTDVVNEVLWRTADARIAAVDGDADGARLLIREAIDLIEGTDARIDQAETWLRLAEIEARLGDRPAAREALERARERYRDKGVLIGVERAERRLAALDA